MAHVEQARITADPGHYPRAERALRSSLDQQAEGNDLAATGMGALGNARATTSRMPPRGPSGRCGSTRTTRPSSGSSPTPVSSSASTTAPAGPCSRFLNLRTDLPALTRASYDLELRGRFEDASALLQRALDQTHSASALAWVRTQLSHLAFSTGDLDAARMHADRGVQLAPGDSGLSVALARVLAAEGREQEAIARWEEVVSARPLPEYFVEYGACVTALGRGDGADDQSEVFAAAQQLFAANGVSDDLGLAQYEADFGDPSASVDHARAELDRQATIDAEDVLAWALHRTARDDLALPHARRATRHGTDPTMLYHRGMIEKAFGLTEDTVEHLSAALERNPHFPPPHAPLATAALAELRGEAGRPTHGRTARRQLSTRTPSQGT